MPKDREKILDRLHAALKDERVSAFNYHLQADEMRRLGRVNIARHLEAIAADHEEHGAGVEERIRALGGEPQAFTPPPEMLARFRELPKKDLCLALEHDLKAEDTEIETYTTLAEQSDGATSAACARFTNDDRGHAAWLRREIVRGMHLDGRIEESEER